ncbi:MAG: PHP domain-containing protein [Thermodesulfobacteria bacterium]|nr:PHP domain-containing protein [Thermodesulfobacteriota bacterium]
MATPESLIDLHVHTDVSPCGHQSLRECLERARGLGLDLLCITDHFSTEAACDLKAISLESPKVVVGTEYTFREGDFLLFVPGKVPHFPPGLPPEEIFSEIHRLGGVVVWAHPFRWGRVPDERLLEEGLVDAIEVLNGRTSPFENEKARTLAEAYGLPMVAGSDAHTAEELGSVANLCPEKVENASDLIEAIREGLLHPTILSKDLRHTYQLAFKGYR